MRKAGKPNDCFMFVRCFFTILKLNVKELPSLISHALSIYSGCSQKDSCEMTVQK